ncbi:hypothetical protein [Pseudomonas frederiksbergensis]|uniref:hypothetical protein n=1 Tax=Pseudomonas frederiksbergensis TaxID=104087 RepID=UPI0032E4ACB0
MDLNKIQDNICKTGFKLEYEVANILRNEGWSLITNRYYLDDHEESVREIDILAYKCRTISNIAVYTAIIISCKKSETCDWALLARDIEENDPNADWQPFKGISSDSSITHYLEKSEWAKTYHERLVKKCPDIFGLPEVDIFAFQEVSKEKSTCQNDKNIFNSITSLMKAQAYELNSLKSRNQLKKTSFYQFNLISVIDSDLIRVKFEDDKIIASQIESENYISKYILNKKESVSRIKFITAKAFENSIKEYSTLHNENAQLIEDLNRDFFKDILQTRERAKILLPEFKDAVKKYLRSPYYAAAQQALNIDQFDISWDNRTKEAIIEIDTTREIVSELNDDDACIRAAKQILLDVFKYTGSVYFEEAIIF